jgi:hypothetical protein
VISVLMTKERRPAIRTPRGWAINLLQEAVAIHECEARGWARDRADPHARERAVDLARQCAPDGVSADEAVAEVRDVLNSIGDTCPECPPDEAWVSLRPPKPCLKPFPATHEARRKQRPAHHDLIGPDGDVVMWQFIEDLYRDFCLARVQEMRKCELSH